MPREIFLSRRRVRAAVAATILGCTVCGSIRVRAQDRFLAKEDIILLGLGLTVQPDHQVVPKDVATVVSTFLSSGTQPQSLPPFAPDAIVKATLRGPSAPNGLDLTASPNTPLNIPPLGVPGIHTLENIRLESGGQTLMQAVPESVTIEVLEKLLVTQVTSRPLTAQEIREKGIVFDKSNFQAYNFTAAFAVQDVPVNISFPVVLPTLQTAQDITLNASDLASIAPPSLPQLKTIIPDTLRLQTVIPNLQLVGFTLSIGELAGKTLAVPPIPGVVVIPGDIAFLNQFFTVKLLVGNVAPAGSNLVVTDLNAEIFLPAGNDTVVGSDDDPLRMAHTVSGEAPRVQRVVQPGLDGVAGTADDVASIAPGESASAEYLVEGRREGSHTIEFNMTGTLNGLPGGPVQITGRAAGSVAVRNPSFTLTFTHPDTVSAGEPYTLDVTVTNTSPSPANFVGIDLFSQNVTGATVVGDPSRQIESIPPGDSASVTFDLVARITGKVTAATLDADDNIAGKFSLKSGVTGELGVPISPDSLVLPKEAGGLPEALRSAALGLLGKGWAVATAPAAALPPDVRRFSKQIVIDRAVQVAEAGMRVSLHEPVADSAAQLAMDFIGSDVARLPALHPNADDLAFAQSDFSAFDELRRRSVRGDVFAAAVASVLAPELNDLGAAPFHQALAEKVAYRPAHLSALVQAAGGVLPFTVSIVDAQGRRLGGADATGKIVKQIPYGDVIPFTNADGATTAALIVIAAPDLGEYHVRFDAVAGVAADAPFTISLVVPDSAGSLRQVVYSNVTGASSITPAFGPNDPYRVLLDLPIGAATGQPLTPSLDTSIVPPPPHALGAVQLADKDLSCGGIQLGRIVALLFNEEMTPASVQDRVPSTQITNYSLVDNAVVGVALQPGGRVAFLALRDPVGPFVPRHVTVFGITDALGHTMASETLPIETTVTDAAAVVSGRALNADGTPLAFANVRLFISDPLCGLTGVSSKSADANGQYSWDWVPQTSRNRVAAVEPTTGDSRPVDFTSQRDGQRLNVDIVMLGRGIYKGVARDENGVPLPSTSIRVTSLTDQSSYGMTTGDDGQFAIGRIPVGNIFVEAVNVAADAKGTLSELIPLAGATVTHDATLFNVSTPKIVVKYGVVSGHVLRADGSSAVADAPVVAYYEHQSQTGVSCPGNPPAGECAVAVVRTDDAGAFVLDHISAGHIRIATFDQATLQQGEASVTLPADGSITANVLLGQGLGTINGTVLDANGHPVAGARVGGGLSLTTTDASGHFVLTDVPVGRREIVAVSDELAARGSSTIDIVQAGQTVDATIVFSATATIAGTVYEFGGSTPVVNNTVYLFYFTASEDGGRKIIVVATAVTDAAGHYNFAPVPIKPAPDAPGYTVSAFRSDLSDGNVLPVVLKGNNQLFHGDIVFRGGGGHVTGTVLDSDGVTPLRAAVGVSGDKVLTAGGVVGVEFQHVTNFQVTNSDITTGQFGFDSVFVGPFTVTAVGQFSPDPISATRTMPTPGAIVDVPLQLQATSRIQGTVFQPDGVTPAGRNILVHYMSSEFKTVCSESGITLGTITVPPGACVDVPQGIQDETVVTDDHGSFVVPLVNAGRFTLTAEDPATGRSAQILGTIQAGQTGDFPIRLLGLSSLTINVRGSDAKTAIPGARVEVTQVAFPKKTITTLANENGVVTLNGGDAFSEGDLVVLATDLRNGFAGRATGRVTKDGDAVTIDIFLFNASGAVFGTVYQADGITPVPHAEVVLSNQGAACGEKCSLAFTVTDSAGAYRVESIPLGAFTVDVFEAATARRAFASGTIDFDRQEVPIDPVEAGRGIVTGTAFAANSLAPLVNWQVFVDQLSPNGQARQLQGMTALDGTFAFPGVAAGSFRVIVSKQPTPLGAPWGYAEATSSIEAEGQHVDVPIVVEVNEQHFGRIEGTVVNPDGTAAANIAVDVCPYAVCNPFGPGGGHLSAVTGDDGSFAIDHVIIGRFDLEAKSQTTQNVVTAQGVLGFEGDIVHLPLALVGLSQVGGSVEYANGQPAKNVQVMLTGRPSSGCSGGAVGFCTAFTDDTGQFSFINVPAQTFEVRAFDPINQLTGVIGGALNPGEHKTVRVLLQATSSVGGRVLHANGSPASGIGAELASTTFGANVDLFQSSTGDGTFAFPVVPPGPYTLTLQDPVGPGLAKRPVQVTTSIALGDLVLDEAAPAIASMTPAAGSVGVPLNSPVHIVFSEPIDAATVTHANVSVVGPAGPLLGTLQQTDADAGVLFTPLAPLTQETRYSVLVSGIVDRIGKAIVTSATAFTTVDLTPPAIAELTPPVGGSGIASGTVIRVKFSEPIDPAKYVGSPIVLTRAGAIVAGRIDYLFGNTVVVFTPGAPLIESAAYHVDVAAATDLAGNVQPQPTSYTFSTTDRTPPQVTVLRAAGDGTVIESGTTQIVADVGADHDVAVVDFFIDDQPALAARSAPFALTLQAIAALGAPGDRIKVSALATDTSGNRSTTPAVVFVPIVADKPPVIAIAAPADGTPFRTGDRVTVTIRVTDDLGTTQIGYRPQTGKPQDAATRAIAPPSLDRTETFAFSVPADATPGGPISIAATAVDTNGHVATASINITVLDNTPPTVTITGTTSGTRVAPGQQTSAVVSAQDLGGVASITLSAGGVLLSTTTRTVTPAQKSVVTTFPLTIPASARPGDTLTLDATATDAAGNTASAARVLLPVADLAPPAVTLRTATGNLDIVPGTSTNLVVAAEDETAVASVTLQAQGAFNVSQARQVSPPSNSTEVTIPIGVPATAAEGATLSVFATASDVFGNVSAPATLTLTVRSQSAITLPPSLLIAAGDSADLLVQLASPAPAGGLRVDLLTSDQVTASVTGSVTFAEGEASKTAQVFASKGGNATISALVNGVVRASMNVTVRGGIVSGIVRDSNLNPVSGVNIVVTNNGTSDAAVTDGAGRYLVENVDQQGSGPFTVKATDPNTHFIGVASAQLNTTHGFAHVDIVLLPAASVSGTVRQVDGQTSAGAGVRVEIAAANDPFFLPLDTVFTDATGAYSFPLVSLGSYVATASDVHGNRGRSAIVALTISGQQADVPITYLGRARVSATVRDGSGNPVANLPVTLRSTSIFGDATPMQSSTGDDGVAPFDDVFVGSFTVQAHDPITNLAGSTSGQVTANAQPVAVDIRLTQWANLRGTVYRDGGTTPAPHARVSVTVRSATAATYFTTTSGTDGAYEFLAVPLGQFSLDVRIDATHEIGVASGSLPTHAQTVTQDVTFFGQGSLLVTVTDTNGDRVAGAQLFGLSNNGVVADGFGGTTDATGVALVEHVLASDNVTIDAVKIDTAARVTTTVHAGEVTPVPIQLQSTAAIVGTVFLPDGQTPASDGSVKTDRTPGANPIGADGKYRIDNLTCCAYDLTAFDAQGRRRAVVRNVRVDPKAQSLYTVDLTFNGLGTIVGRVLNPDGSSASNVFVYVRSLDPDVGNLVGVFTDAAGFYRADDVPAGTISVIVPDILARGVYGEAAGSLVHDGDTLTLDVLLANNVIQLPVIKTDANLFEFDVQRDLSVGYGHDAFSSYYTGRGGFGLDIVRDGVATPFTGSTFGTTQANGHEIAVTQNNVAGLNVTRKLLVSQSYFARALEVLTNPTSAPITVDVRVQHVLTTGSVLATSSGDSTLDATDPASRDQWIAITSGHDDDPFGFNGGNRNPQLGFVFDGAGAASHVATATFTDATTYPYVPAVTYTWGSVTIQPGQTVAFMHFGVLQYSRAAAQASVARLVQLPPEALVSLSPADIAAIRNFSVPADATSAVTPLPALDGTVSGRVLEADGTTPVPDINSNIRFHSNNIFFGRTYTTSSSLDRFTLGPNGDVAHQYVSMALPRDSFTIEATHPVTHVVSAQATAAFPPDAASVTADIVFSNTGIVRGVVRRHTGIVVSGAVLSATAPNFSATYAASDASGSYVVTSVPPGPATIAAALRHPQSTSSTHQFGAAINLTGSAIVPIVAGQTATADLTLQPTGSVTGIVHTATGAAAAGAAVAVLNIVPADDSLKLQTTADSAGRYRFDNVPLGSFAVQATDPVSGIATAPQPVTISQDQTTTADVSLRGIGTVPVTAVYTTGQAAQSAYVEYRRAGIDQNFVGAGFTDANGRVTIANVPVGSVVVRVHRPGSFSGPSVDVSAVVQQDAQVVPVAVTVLPAGTIDVQVNTPDGTPVAGAFISSDVYSSGVVQSIGSADGSGHFSVANVTGGTTYVFRAASPSTSYDYRETTARIVQEGQLVRVTIVVGSIGSVSGRLFYTDGSVASQLSMTVVTQTPPQFFSAITDSSGMFQVSGVPTGSFRIVAQDPFRHAGGSFVGILAAHGDAVHQDITLADRLTPIDVPGANGYTYRIGSSGALLYSDDALSSGYSTSYQIAAGASDAGFVSYQFAGDVAATPELDSRQFILRDFNGGYTLPQRTVAGVVVTRKIYAPSGGSFVRYVEIFDNPTPDPVTLDVQVNAQMITTRIAATSSGDAALTAADSWIVTDRPDSARTPAVAHVFAGAHARATVSDAGVAFNSESAPQERWNGVTIPAAGRVAFMHFTTEASDASTAQAAAERLVQLPPDALTGLTPEETAAIVNFDVPAGVPPPH